jgi:hypothetical protein
MRRLRHLFPNVDAVAKSCIETHIAKCVLQFPGCVNQVLNASEFGVYDKSRRDQNRHAQKGNKEPAESCEISLVAVAQSVERVGLIILLRLG